VLSQYLYDLVVPDNSNRDDDHDGYANLEEWLQEYAKRAEQTNK
jgi:hypothetical protein